MNITYLIGNGFDLHFGLQTRYQDFLKYYEKQKPENKNIGSFKKKWLQKFDFWSDLELALGERTGNFSGGDIETYINFIKDMQIALAEYCEEEQKKAALIEEERKKKVKKDIVSFAKYFKNEEIEAKINRLMPSDEDYLVNFVVFNYTNTLETIIATPTEVRKNSLIYGWQDQSLLPQYYKAQLGNLIHIHGTTRESMILGVNDSEQISNNNFAGNDKFLDEIVKPRMNRNCERNRERKVIDCINDSNIICIYGMSMGDTDKLWWQTIGKRLTQDDEVNLVIFDIPPRGEHSTRDFFLSRCKAKKELFLSKSSLSDQDKTAIKDRIYICLSDEFF